MPRLRPASWWTVLYTYYYTSLLEELSSSYVTPLGKDSWSSCSFHLDFVHVPVPFADFAWCSFSVINHSCEYRSMLSPVGPSSKSLNLGVVLETPETGGNLGKYPHGEEFSRSSMRQVFDKYRKDSVYKNSRIGWLLLSCIDDL